LAFFSKKLQPSIQKLSTYDRELHAVYEAVRHFRHMFEGKHVTVFTDHKPLLYAFQQRTERATPWQFRRLDFVGQFTTDIRHVSGHENVVADIDPELQDLRNNQNLAIQWQQINYEDYPISVYCDVSSGKPRPYIPGPLRKQVFDSLHSLAYPGVKASIKLVTERYVWPAMRKDSVPLKNGDADTVALALIQNWIARYGVPLRITSDQGTQFTSALFQAMKRFFGIKHLRTTPGHPQANGMVEWSDALPAVLFGLRAAWKEDIQAKPAELVYGEPIRLPGELIVPSNRHVDVQNVLRDLRADFHNLAPADTTRHGKKSVFCFRDLATCTHVLVRNDQIGPAFSAPYEGPFEVV
ncbi:GSCOCG00011083001-RA-CDS, partial [Cotesia congregata]